MKYDFTATITIDVDDSVSEEDAREYVGFEIGARASCSMDNPVNNEDCQFIMNVDLDM